MTPPTCPTCSGPVQPAAGARVRVYCSPECKQRAKDARKTDRYRRDPEYRAQVTARKTNRLRKLGVRARRTGTRRTCPECSSEFDGILTKVYCSATCRRRAAKRRESPFLAEEVLLGGLADTPAGRTGVQVRVVARPVRRHGGLFVYCPNPGHLDRVLMGADDMVTRRCSCGTTLRLNEEEVEWVTSRDCKAEVLELRDVDHEAREEPEAVPGLLAAESGQAAAN